MGARGNSSDEDPSSVSEFEDESMSEGASTRQAPAKKGKTIEQRYTKMTQLEHILARPDTYVGSTSLETTSAWVWSPEKNGIVMRQISYVPALYKIFDEIIVNAADVKARELFEDGRAGGKKMTRLDIIIDEEEGSVSVGNDGSCIPIEIHKEHNVYVPELIFGHLLTSDNYDDSEKRVTGGRNGYGAKLTNVFSKKFSVDCSDIKHKRYFHMTWSANMTRHTEPSITSRAGPDSGLIFSQGRCPSDYVRVKFWPDFARLNMPEGKFTADVISLFQKRAYDMAGSVAGIAVYLNGERLSYVKSFRDYVDLYFPERAKAPSAGDSSPKRKKKKSGTSSASASENEADEPMPVKAEDGGEGAADLLPPPLKIYEKINDMWEVVISESETGAFQQVSFVNSICTSKGGTHIALLIEPIVQAVLKKVNTKNRGGFEVKGSHVKNHIFIFVNCRVVNPTFDSQTKEWMSLSMKALTSGGAVPSVSDKTITAIVKSGITENVILWAQMKESVELKKMMKGKNGGAGGRDRIIGIPKLEDANDAGTSKWKDCTLILTEGDSAKTSCIAGLSVVGKDKYGVFPLRGKLLNVRDASFQSLSENKEIQNLLKITGLEIKHKSVASAAVAADTSVFPRLRYGSIMIMTDQDYDGSHIKGLLINLLQYYWPEILKLNSGFLKQFITPIIKATKKSTTGKPKVLSFFTIKQYQEWKRAMEASSSSTSTDGASGPTSGASSALSSWTIKYYKGLGTSTDKEFIEYFKDLGKHSLEFTYEDEADFETIDMAFNAKRAEDRKRWISSFNEESGMEYCQPTGRESTGAPPQQAAPLVRVRYSDFINKELVQFSRYDLERSIPCLVDGLKPAQRKAVFGALKKGLFTKEMKVAQLAAYISDVSCYHHGEDSMAAALVNMAQTFVGSTNINVFEPRGQFGSRKEGGKDASATRYIYTKLTKISKAIFKADDDPILQYRNEEGKAIEPKFYVPIIPMILVNGSEGIGTGWSSSVPNFNPAEIIQNIRIYLLHREQLDAENPNVMIDAGANEGELKGMLQPMKPWYRGFIGRIEENAKGSYDSIGIVETIDDEGTLFISELPVKQWTQPYKEFLEDLLQIGLGRETAPAAATAKASAKAKAKARAKASAAPRRVGAAGFQSHHKLAIDDYRDNSTHESIAFTIKMTDEQRQIAESMGGLEKALKLRKPITTSNMTLFDDQGQVRKYADELEILLAFCRVRLHYYQKRKRFRVISLEKEMCLISNKLKFVLAVVEGSLRVNNRKKQELEAELLRLGFDPREVIDARHNTANETLVTEVDVDGTLDAPDVDEELVKEQENRTKPQESGPGGQFDYLLGMQIYNLTFEKVEQLKRQHQAKEQELNTYRAKTVNQLWLEDLAELEAAILEADLAGSAEKAEAEKARRVAQGLAAHSRPLKVAPKRRAVKKTVKKEVPENDDDDSLFDRLKAATNAAEVGPGKARSEAPHQKSTTTTSSSDFGLMEALRMRLNADSTIASSGLPASGPTASYSNPPGQPERERKKRVSPPTSNPIATTHAVKRSKKVTQSDEEDDEEEGDEVMSLSEEDDEEEDDVVVDDDEEDDGEESEEDEEDDDAQSDSD